MNINIKISLKNSEYMPKYATPGSAGADVVAAITESLTVQASETVKIPCGFSLELPQNYEAQIRPRSGLAARNGITVLNSPGTIDSDYRGEVCVLLHNTSTNSFTINPGMRIAQMVIAPVVQPIFQEVSPDSLEKSERGQAGFGSSGV